MFIHFVYLKYQYNEPLYALNWGCTVAQMKVMTCMLFSGMLFWLSLWHFIIADTCLVCLVLYFKGSLNITVVITSYPKLPINNWIRLVD
jgi:hypothetical protein